MGLSTTFSLLLLVNAFCQPSAEQSSSAITQKLDAKEIEKLIYDRLRKQRAFKCDEIPYEIYVKRVEGKTLHSVTFFRRAAKNDGFDLFGFAKSMELGIDNKNRRVLAKCSKFNLRTSDGSEFYFRFKTWNIDFPKDISFLRKMPSAAPRPSKDALKRIADFKKDISEAKREEELEERRWKKAFAENNFALNYPIKVHWRRFGVLLASLEMEVTKKRRKLKNLYIVHFRQKSNGDILVLSRISTEYGYIISGHWLGHANDKDTLEFELPDGTKLSFRNRSKRKETPSESRGDKPPKPSNCKDTPNPRPSSNKNSPNIATLLAVATSDPPTNSTTEIKWREYKAGLAEAKQKNRPLCILFEIAISPWDLLFSSKTSMNPKVSKLLGEKFIPVLVRGEKQPNISATLKIQSFPTVILAQPDGKIILRVVGFQSPEKFLKSLNFAMQASR